MERVDVDRQTITSRWLEYEGELRAGLLRVVLITCFYTVELVTYLSAAKLDEAAQQFHRQATYLSAAWLLVSLAALVAIARHWMPSGLKYASCAMDVGLLTAVAWFGSGAASPLVCLYLLLIVMAGLRGSLKLIWFVTSLALIAYVSLLYLPAHDFKTIDTLVREGARQPKPIAVMVVALGIAASGLVTGQLVRMLRQIVSEVCLRSTDVRAMNTANTEVKV